MQGIKEVMEDYAEAKLTIYKQEQQLQKLRDEIKQIKENTVDKREILSWFDIYDNSVYNKDSTKLRERLVELGVIDV